MIPTLGFLVFWVFASAWPLVRASKFEGYSLHQVAAIERYGFFIAYLLTPFGTYAFLSGVVRTSSSWVVTGRRG